LINKVQIDKELTYVIFDDADLPLVAENILRDSGVEFEKIVARKKNKPTMYKLIPDDSPPDALKDIDVEIFEDEIVEEGYLF